MGDYKQSVNYRKCRNGNENLVVGNLGLEYTAFDSFLFVPEYRPLLSCPL